MTGRLMFSGAFAMMGWLMRQGICRTPERYFLERVNTMQYDVIIIGAGPGGIFSAYELSKLCPEEKIAVFEEGQPLEKRRCPIDGKNVKRCIG